MASLGAWHPELRDDAFFDPGLVPVGWFWEDLIVAEEAPGGVTGTLAVTLAGATLAGTGAVAVSATGAATLAGVVLVGTGAVAVSGSLAQTLGGVTLVATGTVTVAAVDGTLAVTLDNVALSSAGAIAVAATATVTLQDASLVGSGAVGVAGTLTVTLDDAVLAGTGLVVSGEVTGSLSISLQDITVAILGAAAFPLPVRPDNSAGQSFIPAQVIDRTQVQKFLDLEASRMRARINVQKKNLQDEMDEAQRRAEEETRQRIEDAKKDRHHTNNHLDFRMQRLQEEERAVARMQNKLRLEDGRAILADKRLEAPKKRRK